MLRVLNLEAGYGPLRVLKGISLHVSPGEAVAIIGANGAGKTTLLQTIAGLHRPRAGTIVFDRKEIQALPAERVVGRGCSRRTPVRTTASRCPSSPRRRRPNCLLL